MKRFNQVSAFVLGSIVSSAVIGQAPVTTPGAPATADTPFQLYVAAGAVNDDNLLRLADSADAESLLGTPDYSGRYQFIGIGFDSVTARENRRIELRGDVNQQTYKSFSDFDHTSGRFRAALNWKGSDTTEGDFGYRYRRELRSFSNQDIPIPDIITENALFASTERKLKQRLLLRFGGEIADLQFGASPLLGKQRSSIESELQYAASQSSTFGVLATFTQSRFDANAAQDFSGWSIGPSLRWQIRSNLTLTANAGYTHQELDEAQPDVSDFDGVTGFVAAEWKPNDRFSWRLRAFRDISDLGGEIPLYTERTGASLQPSWQISENLASRVQLEYQRRDFIRSSFDGINREDEYRLAALWLDLTVARRWLISLGLGSEQRDSSVDARDFDDVTVRTSIRFNL